MNFALLAALRNQRGWVGGKSYTDFVVYTTESSFFHVACVEKGDFPLTPITLQAGVATMRPSPVSGRVAKGLNLAARIARFNATAPVATKIVAQCKLVDDEWVISTITHTPQGDVVFKRVPPPRELVRAGHMRSAATHLDHVRVMMRKA